METSYIFFFQAEDGIRDLVRSRGLGDVYKRQQWNHAKQGIITATKLDIHEDLLRYLVRKEADKMFTDGDARTKGLAAQAVSLTLDLVFAPEVPLEPQA